MREHALHRHAHLTRVVEAALERAWAARSVEVGIVGATITGAAPPCSSPQRAPGASRERSLQPTRRAADEAEEARRARSVTRRPGDAAVGKAAPAPRFGQARFAQDADEAQARQRRGRGGLDHHRAAGGDRRADLVDDEVEGMVEGADRDDDADRLALVNASRPPTRR